MFGCLAVAISLARFISPLLLNNVLRAELKMEETPPYDGHPTITYYMAAGILILPMIVNL